MLQQLVHYCLLILYPVWNEQLDVIDIYSNQLSDDSESIHLSSGTN